MDSSADRVSQDQTRKWKAEPPEEAAHTSSEASASSANKYTDEALHASRQRPSRYKHPLMRGLVGANAEKSDAGASGDTEDQSTSVPTKTPVPLPARARVEHAQAIFEDVDKENGRFPGAAEADDRVGGDPASLINASDDPDAGVSDRHTSRGVTAEVEGGSTDEQFSDIDTHTPQLG